MRERDPAPEAPVVETAPAVTEPTTAPTPEPTTEPTTEPATVSEEPDGSAGQSEPSRLRRALIAVVTLVWIAAVAVSAGRLAEAHDLWTQPENVTRVGAVVATWLAIVVLARRCGGRFILIGVFAGVVLGLVTAYPEDWALAGAGVTAATVHGVLGMTLTRPAKGLRPLREMLISALIGAAGAVVVTGYDVMLRPFRFRIMVLTLVLLAGFALAWRLGQGVGSLGRRGLVLIGGGVLVLALSIAYSQAIRAWGSPGVVSSVSDLVDTLESRLGAVPRPIEALVGFPALVWGVATRTRRRQGWWMCAFGALGAAGVATSLIQPTTPFVDSITATGYDLVIGGASRARPDRAGPARNRTWATRRHDLRRPARAPRATPLRPAALTRRRRDEMMATGAVRVDHGKCRGGVPERPIGTALKAVAGSDVSRGFESRLLRPRENRDMTADASTHVVYRWPRARLVAVLGRIVMVLGALWVVATIAVAAWDLSDGWLLALGLVSLGVLAASAVLFARPPAVLELTEEGYRVSGVRGGGTAAARWTDVRAVSTGESVAGPVLVLEGRAAPSVVPLELLGPQAADAEVRIRALLDAAHGRSRS